MKAKAVVVMAVVMAMFRQVQAEFIEWKLADGGNGNYYGIVNPGDPLPKWLDAKTAAEGLTFQGVGGHLATVTSANENEFIVDNLLTGFKFNKVGSAWLGGFQSPEGIEPAGGWQWVTGEPWIYTNWYAGNHQPNDELGTQDYLEMLGKTVGFNGEWNDIGDEISRFPYIVEFETGPAPIPELSTFLLVGLGLGVASLVGYREHRMLARKD